MAEELGKIERLPVEGFKKGRKLYFIPLILSVRESDVAFTERINKYWEQVETHLRNLEEKLGKISRIFHELISASGEEGAKTVAVLCEESHKIIQSRVAQGAQLQPVEEDDLLVEFMDWSRCLSIGLQSQKAFRQVYEAYASAQKKRNEIIAKKIDEALLDNEIGILLMREGHQVQFPADIQVFYVAPPALEELKRWLREREAAAEKAREESADKPEK